MTEKTEPAATDSEKKPPRVALLIATGFGLGYLPKAPGTWGSLAGALLVAGIWSAPSLPVLAVFRSNTPGIGYEVPRLFGLPVIPMMPIQFLLAAVTAGLGVLVAAQAARFTGRSDPQQVVIDEICGQQIALLGAAIGPYQPQSLLYLLAFPLAWSGWKYLLAGFILFRVFDIWKPFPARQAEALPGGWGIMADDWVAGIYAAICLWLIRLAGF